MAQSKKTPVKAKVKAKATKVKSKVKHLVKKVMCGSTLYTPEEGKLPPAKEHADLMARGFIVELESGEEVVEETTQSNTTVVARLNEDEKFELGTTVKNDHELANAMNVEEKANKTDDVDLNKVLNPDSK